MKEQTKMKKEFKEGQEWGISYPCPNCSKEIKFPSCPNFDTERGEQLAHMIYTECANMKRLCWECESKVKIK